MKILIVDDHALVRDALARVLATLEPGLVLRQTADPRAAFDALEHEPDIDLVLLDLGLPGMHGLTALRTLRERYPAIGVAIVSATLDAETVRHALEAGALGYIPKTSSNETLRSALQLILAGSVYVPPEILGPDERVTPMGFPSPAPRLPADIGLTSRQAEILAWVMKGESNKVICREMDLAPSTVKNHISAILRALNVTSRAKAVVAIGKLGVLLPRVARKK